MPGCAAMCSYVKYCFVLDLLGQVGLGLLNQQTKHGLSWKRCYSIVNPIMNYGLFNLPFHIEVCALFNFTQVS